MPWIRSYRLSIQKREEIAYFALRITNDQIFVRRPIDYKSASAADN